MAWSQVGLVQRLLLLSHQPGGWSPISRSPTPSAQEGPRLSLPRGLSQLP